VTQLTAPAKVEAMAGKFVFRIAAGPQVSYAVTDSGVAYSWGWGGHPANALGYVLPPGVPPTVFVPMRIEALLHLRVGAISAGRTHTLFLCDGKVFATGRSRLGLLGCGLEALASLRSDEDSDEDSDEEEEYGYAYSEEVLPREITEWFDTQGERVDAPHVHEITAGAYASIASVGDGFRYGWGAVTRLEDDDEFYPVEGPSSTLGIPGLDDHLGFPRQYSIAML
jgi:alpha-tubulin suppressor-like RCC1 family protein